MVRPPQKNYCAMITGASSGIGRSIALQMAQHARTLILVARRQARLETLKDEIKRAHSHVEVIVAPCDLSNIEEIKKMLTSIESQNIDIDVLVNNAGFGDIAQFADARWDKLEQMLAVNITAPSYLTHALLPGMITRKSGGIMNISSGFAFTFMPGFATYAASKMHLSGFSEALALELRSANVSVTHVCPGPVATEFEAVAENPFERSVPSWVALSPERCAKLSVRAFHRGQVMFIPGTMMKLTFALARMTPTVILRFVYRIVAREFRLSPQESSR